MGSGTSNKYSSVIGLLQNRMFLSTMNGLWLSSYHLIVRHPSWSLLQTLSLFTDQSNLPLDSNQHINPSWMRLRSRMTIVMKILMKTMLYMFLCPVERYRKTIREVHLFFSDLYENKGSYQPHRQPFEHHEAEDVGIPVSSVATNMQGLPLQECPKNETSKSDASPVRQAMDHGFFHWLQCIIQVQFLGR